MFAGIDAGSLSFKVIVLSNGQYIKKTIFHNGEPIRVFDEILESLGLRDNYQNILISGRYGALLSNKYRIPLIDPVKSIVLNYKKEIDQIIDIGSSKLCLIELRDGSFHRYNTNSLCASGTGAFLDQQMKRMGIDYENLNNIPLIQDPVSIATRCAVFAKSDLIHRQQQGYSIDMLWNGLAKGMAESAFSTLFRGKNTEGKIMLIGGLTYNRIFVHYLSRLVLPAELLTFEDATYFQAESNLKYKLSNKDYDAYAKLYQNKKETEDILVFSKSEEKSHLWERDEFDNEVDIFNISHDSIEDVFIGIDIGSTSTKLVVVDGEGRILFGLYNRTKGKPIFAFKKLLQGIIRIQSKYNLKLNIKGMGTTGSGRKLVGQFAGADIIINEITAHLKGALKEFPQIRTIFEIGGQDSKYISVEDSWMKDANMNYVCAAGTGSFIEEQAENLGISLEDIEKLCHNVRPPVSSDRCTVFMEQDSTQLLINGFTRSEVMASMLYSVCKNYLNRVVHHRPITEPILFIGATSKNKGLVKAFENIIDKQILTSDYGHIMGALGITELLRNEVPEKTRFRGMDIHKEEVVLRETNCNLCINKCRITNMEIKGYDKKISWGYMCGKEPESETVRKNTSLKYLDQLSKIQFPKPCHKIKGKKIFMPKGLQYYSHYPFWQKFFSILGIELYPSIDSNAEVADYSKAYNISDFCYPLKLTIGHIIKLYKANKLPVFIPYHIQDISNPNTEKSHFCPISQSLPSIIRNTLEYNNIYDIDIISPIIDFELDSSINAKKIRQAISSFDGFSFTEKEIKNAFETAHDHHIRINDIKKEAGAEIIKKLKENSKKHIVLMGRPYNIFDKVLNLGLTKSLSNYGFDIIPADLLPIQRKDIGKDFRDIYWAYGQQLIASAEYIKNDPDLFGIYLTNFSCGPDSFLLSTIEKIMDNKPFLILELDELGGDAGYITRIEAFFDRINNFKRDAIKDNRRLSFSLSTESSINGKRIFIPPMHPIAVKMMSSAFRAYSIDAVAMEKEDMHTYNIGRSVVRGSECMPAASTIGSFLYYLKNQKENNNGSNMLFMPCTNGPCRFGQYARLHYNILKDNKINASIFSPTSEDNYGDLSGGVRMHLIKSIVISDLFTKIGCAMRPYEKNSEQVDSFLGKYIEILSNALERKENIIPLLKKAKDEALLIPLDRAKKKPLIGIVGEIYVRNSPFSNSYLINNIEKFGGEAWLCSTLEWLHYTAYLDRINSKGIKGFLKSRLSNFIFERIEHRYFGIFREILNKRMEPSIDAVLDTGREYVPMEFTGETILTIGRGIHFIKQGADMIVNVSPFTCMPGTISSAIFRNISKKYRIPIISMFYDGETDFNDLLNTYISNIK